MMAGANNSITISIEQQLTNLREGDPNCCIYLVPENLRRVNEDAYKPLLVSIGPIHSKDARLEVMHELKLRYLKHFGKRCSNDSIDIYREVIRRKVIEARNYYVETIQLPPTTTDEFVNMLLLDGVFIVELFLRGCVDEKIDVNDRIFSKPRMIVEITRDIRLEENQIPFFILEDLYRKVPVLPQTLPFADVAYKFFMGKTSVVPQRIKAAAIRHLVDLLRLCHLPSQLRPVGNQNVRFEFTFGVTKLRDCGVTFVASTSENLLDVKFANGVLEIPRLEVTDDTESLFKNIMVYEQCHHFYDSYIIDYFAFLNSLINTPEDVEILVRKRIIENWLGNSEEVANLFSKLFKEIRLINDQFYYSQICRDLNAYANKPWHYYATILFRKYFNLPWAIIALIYATVMLILTVLQVYTGFKQLKGSK